MMADGRPLSIEKLSDHGVHYFLLHISLGVELVPVFEGMALLHVNSDETVHLLHSLFSVPDSLYSTDWRLFSCCVDLPIEGLPPKVELPVDAFVLERCVCTFLREDHTSHLKGVTPSVKQAIPCEIVVKAAEGGHNFSCQGITYVAPYGAAHLLDNTHNIVEYSQLLFPLLTGRALPFSETLDWL